MRTKNSRFLETDQLARIPQVFRMIQIDRGDNRHIRLKYIHRIQTPAQAHFQNHHIKFGLSEQPQRRQRTEFKVGQRNLTACGFHRRKPCTQSRIVRHAAIDTHPLVIANQVGRGITPHAITGGQQHRLQHGAGRAFAVGAADGDDREGGMQLKLRLHRTYAIQAKRNGFWM